MSNEGEAPFQPAFEKVDEMRRNELADIFKTPGITRQNFAPVVLFDCEGGLVLILYMDSWLVKQSYDLSGSTMNMLPSSWKS